MKRWVTTNCVPSWRCSANPAILHREFSKWSYVPCSQLDFVAELGRLGFAPDADGMIAGLALGADFVAAVEIEHNRRM